MSPKLDSSGSSFSLIVIRRILDVLGEAGTIRKTNLAARAGLNYPNCTRYIDFLKLLGWVESSADGTNCVCMTEIGRRFSSHLAGLAKQNAQTIAPPPKDEIVIQKVDAKAIQPTNVVNDNIMLVEDEPDVLSTYKVFLAKAGYNVDAFLDPQSALQAIRSNGPLHYSLVITDIRMKNINGLQLYREIRSMCPDLKVIFVTALDAIDELVSIMPSVTSNDIIRKPVDQSKLVKIAKEAINDVRSNRSGGLSLSPRVR